MLKPLIWNISDQTVGDINWPKRLIGSCCIYIEEMKMIILIGGNFNLIENLNNNLKINSNLLHGISKNIENFYELEKEKIKYINEMVYESPEKYSEVYIYEFSEKKWSKNTTSGKIPTARSFHKCFYTCKLLE